MVGLFNPFNIRHTTGNLWIGQNKDNPQTKGFVNFTCTEYGVRAAAILLMRSYRKIGVVTIAEIINRYAPPKENKTEDYINYVCSKLGSFPWDVPTKQFPELLHAMSIFEGNKVPLRVINEVIEKYHIVPLCPKKR